MMHELPAGYKPATPITYDARGRRCCVACGEGRYEDEFKQTHGSRLGRARMCRSCINARAADGKRTRQQRQAVADAIAQAQRAAQALDLQPKTTTDLALTGPWEDPIARPMARRY